MLRPFEDDGSDDEQPLKKRARTDHYFALTTAPTFVESSKDENNMDTGTFYFGRVLSCFPYLANVDADGETDWQTVFNSELSVYKQLLRLNGLNVTDDVLTSALQGHVDVIAREQNPQTRIILLGLMLSNGHDLPFGLCSPGELTEILERSLFFMARNGRLEDIKNLVSRFPTVDFSSIFVAGWIPAVSLCHFQTADFFHRAHPMPTQIAEKLLVSMCANGNFVAFDYLMRRCQISFTCLVQGFKQSAYHDQLEIFARILSHLKSDHRDEEWELWDVLLDAINKNHVSIVRFLLSSDVLHPYHLEAARSAALDSGRTEIAAAIQKHQEIKAQPVLTFQGPNGVAPYLEKPNQPEDSDFHDRPAYGKWW